MNFLPPAGRRRSGQSRRPFVGLALAGGLALLTSPGCSLLVLAGITHHTVPPRILARGRTILALPFTMAGSNRLSRHSRDLAERVETLLTEHARDEGYRVADLSAARREVRALEREALLPGVEKCRAELAALDTERKIPGLAPILSDLEVYQKTEREKDIGDLIDRLRKIPRALRDTPQAPPPAFEIAVAKLAEAQRAAQDISLPAIAKKFKAGLVLTGDIEELSTNDPEHIGLLKGKIKLRVQVLDMDQEAISVFDAPASHEWPASTFEGPNVQSDEFEILEKLFETSARKMAELFYEHEGGPE